MLRGLLIQQKSAALIYFDVNSGILYILYIEFGSASGHFHEPAQRNDHRMYIAKECNRCHKHNTEVKVKENGKGGGIMSSLAELTYSAPLVDICSPDPH